MEPHGRDLNQENIIEGMIRGEEAVGDVTSLFLNNSGEGDESPLVEKGAFVQPL